LKNRKPVILYEEFSAEDKVDLALLENSVHFLFGEITEENVLNAIKWIVYENLSPNKTKHLTLYINSPGGDLYHAFALIDVIKASKRPIHTIGIGTIMSSGFLIFVSGSKGHRYISTNTGIMCHQYSDSPVGKHHDLKASMIEGEHCERRMFDILKTATNLSISEIKNKLLPATDVYLTAIELIELGAADYIFT